MESKNPFPERDLAALKDSANRYRELLGAMVCSNKDLGHQPLPLSGANAIYSAAMRANRAFGPADSLKMFSGLFIVVKDGILKIAHDSLDLRFIGA